KQNRIANPRIRSDTCRIKVFQTDQRVMTSASNNTEGDAAQSVGAELYYRTQLHQGNFVIQRCSACSKAIFYPRMVCPHCGGADLQWFAPSGRGTVYSTTVVR